MGAAPPPIRPPARQSDYEIAFGFLIDFEKPLMRPDEAARILGRSLNYIYGCIESGELDAHKPMNREVNRYMITRRSVALHLARSATYRSGDFMDRIKALLGEMTAPQLDELIRDAGSLRKRKFVA
jgi:hypothetical protein